MLTFLDFLTFGITLIFVIFGLKRIFQTKTVCSADIVCFTLFVFYGMPIVYDYIVTTTPSDWFYVSWVSRRVRYIYDILLLVGVLLIQLGARTKPSQRETLRNRGFTREPLQASGVVTFFTILAWCVLLMPIPAVLLFSPKPMTYLGYHRSISEAYETSRGFAGAHNLISFMCIAALGAFFLIYWVRTRQTRSSWDAIRWIAVSLALIAVFIHSKRTAILFFLGIIFIVNFLEHRLRFSKVLIYAVVTLVGLYIYIGAQKGLTRSPLEFLRGDFARDYTLRHAIYRGRMTESSIVPYRGVTYLFTAVAYVPRVVWPNKPWPANVYFTRDVFNWTSSENIGWNFGFGFLEELVMNFGYMGILGCFFIGRISRTLDKFIYERSSYYAILWLPLVFSCVFASSVVLKLVVVLVVPTMIFGRVFAGPGSWLVLDSGEYENMEGEYYINENEDANSVLL